jgi:hypothetical protein
MHYTKSKQFRSGSINWLPSHKREYFENTLMESRLGLVCITFDSQSGLNASGWDADIQERWLYAG